MNGILALGHFCETHGPSVILCTQALAELHSQQPPHILTVPWCNACKSIELDHVFTSQHESSTYVTVRTALKQEMAFLLKQACVRSLSCEEETGKDGGTVYFGDCERGHVLSYTFRLPDSLARGFHRLFTIILFMRDKVHLLNSWPFVTTHLKKLINYLKEHASKINALEQNECSQRQLRIATGTPTGLPRSLNQLTGIPDVFSQIHLWFTWILIAGSKEISEHNTIPVNLSPWLGSETDEGFTLVQMSNSVSTVQSNNLGKVFKEIYHKTNPIKFKTICYCVLLGMQVIVRGTEEQTTSILNALTLLVPKKWCKVVPYSDEYLRPETCNFLGLGLHIAVPQPNEYTIRIDIVDDIYHIKWTGILPEKVPTILSKIMKAVENDLLQDEILQTQINVFVEEWSNNAQSIFWVEQSNSSDKLVNLLQVMGVQPCDLQLMRHWLSQIALYSK